MTDVGPLSALTNLQQLDLQYTSVSDVGPLSALTNLQQLSLEGTSMTDVGPLSALTNLQQLSLEGTSMTDVGPLSALTNLQQLNLWDTSVREVPRDLLFSSSLRELRFGRIEGVPSDLPNSLEALRAHVQDKDPGSIEDRELKLIVLGNGRVGKTSILRRLVEDRFDRDENPTHGIRLVPWTFEPADAPALRLNVWDFGGQDIYHGTHRMFLSTRSVILLVWNAASNETANQHPDVYARPLSYWMDYIRALAPRSSVVVVQNRCDSLSAVQPPPAHITEDPLVTTCHFSAKDPLPGQRETIRAHIEHAVGQAFEQLNSVSIGKGRHAVKETLQQYLVDDRARAPEDRRHREITTEHFQALCDSQSPPLTSWRAALEYFHDSGVLFYDERLLPGRIVIDQEWAIEAIYALLDPDSLVFEYLQAKRGRFRLSELRRHDWARRYSPAEQKLFVRFMLACEICAELPHDSDDEDGPYLMPQALPGRQTVEARLDDRWGPDEASTVGVIYEHRFLHERVVQRFVLRAAAIFGETEVFWNSGTCIRHGDGRLLVEHRATNERYGGRIVALARGPNRLELLRRAHKELSEVQTQLSFTRLVHLDNRELDFETITANRTVATTGNLGDLSPFIEVYHAVTRDQEAPELAHSVQDSKATADMSGFRASSKTAKEGLKALAPTRTSTWSWSAAQKRAVRALLFQLFKPNELHRFASDHYESLVAGLKFDQEPEQVMFDTVNAFARHGVKRADLVANLLAVRDGKADEIHRVFDEVEQ